MQKLYQRKQYKKWGPGRLYWDYKENCIISQIEDEEIIFDIGCGAGIMLEKLIERFPDRKINGIDSSNENVEFCKKFGLPVNHGSVYDLKMKNKSVDCVVFLEVIEHLSDAQKAIQEIYRVLKKDRKLILLFPNDLMFKIIRLTMFYFKEALCNSGHLRQWSPKNMRAILQKQGFKIIKQKSIPFYFWPMSLHHLVVAKK